MIRDDQNLPDSQTVPDELFGGKTVSDLGTKLRAIRGEFLAKGGQLLTRGEVMDELTDRRGGTFRLVRKEEDIR